jgi:hypothetical protein
MDDTNRVSGCSPSSLIAYPRCLIGGMVLVANAIIENRIASRRDSSRAREQNVTVDHYMFIWIRKAVASSLNRNHSATRSMYITVFIISSRLDCAPNWRFDSLSYNFYKLLGCLVRLSVVDAWMHAAAETTWWPGEPWLTQYFLMTAHTNAGALVLVSKAGTPARDPSKWMLIHTNKSFIYYRRSVIRYLK